MNILVLSNLYPPDIVGGYEVACAQIVADLRGRGHDVTVLTSRSEGICGAGEPWLKRELVLADIYDRSDKGDALRIATDFQGRVIELRNIARIAEVLATQAIDVVYCFNIMGLGGLAIVDLLESLPVPWVWHLMDRIPAVVVENVRPEIGALFKFYADRTMRATQTICMSRRLSEELAAEDVAAEPPVLVIPGFTQEIAGRAREPSDPCRFVAVGTLSEEKGTSLILQALALLPPAERARCTLTLFGPGPVEAYRREATRLGVDDRTTFRGLVPHADILRELPSFDALLFPTWEREPFGLVALEAAAAGALPVITKGCGASEVLADGVHAVHIERSVEALAAVMVRTIRDRAWARAIATAARDHVLSTYTIDHIGARIERCLVSAARDGCRVTRDDAETAVRLARFKYGLCRPLVVVGTQEATVSRPPEYDIRELYRMVKAGSHPRPRWRPSRLVRSALLRILKPALLEILRGQRDLGLRVRELERSAGAQQGRHPGTDAGRRAAETPVEEHPQAQGEPAPRTVRTSP